MSASDSMGSVSVSLWFDRVASSATVGSEAADSERLRHLATGQWSNRPVPAHAEAKTDGDGADSSSLTGLSEVESGCRRQTTCRRRNSRREPVQTHAKIDVGITMTPILPTNVVAEARMARSTTFCGVQLRSKTRVPLASVPEISHPLAYPSMRVDDPRFAVPWTEASQPPSCFGRRTASTGCRFR